MKNIFFVLILLAPALVQGYCDAESLKSCVSGTALESYMSQRSQPLFASHTEEELTGLCRDFTTSVSACWTHKMEGCGESVTRALSGVTDAFNYLCGPGLQKYKRSLQCLVSSAVKPQLELCVARLSEKMIKAQDEANTEAELEQIACVDMKEAIECLDERVRDYCGREAAEFESTFMNKALKPFWHRCSSEDEDSNEYDNSKETVPDQDEDIMLHNKIHGVHKRRKLLPIVIGASAGFLVLVSIVIIISVVACRKKRDSIRSDLPEKSKLPYSQFI